MYVINSLEVLNTQFQLIREYTFSEWNQPLPPDPRVLRTDPDYTKLFRLCYVLYIESNT